MPSDSAMLAAQRVLVQTFGYDKFRDQQAAIIERTLQGDHSLVIMPTGGGKSLCYQIPALVLADRQHPLGAPPLTLVISPLISLMKDQVDKLLRLGVSATFINSTLPADERSSRYQQIARGQYKLVYVTPERFRKTEFNSVLKQRQISLLAVDEAHCISQWGHDFRPEYSRLQAIRCTLGNPTTIALTATATRAVQADIVAQLGLTTDQMPVFHAGIDRPNLCLKTIEVWSQEDKLQRMVEVFERNPGSGIIYFTLIKTLQEFSEIFADHRLPHWVYHGDLPRSLRRQVHEQFLDQPDQLVLATNAFGMGIDKADIRFVIHAEIPGSLESYYQEIGRAGRDGIAAECLLLYDQSDLETQVEFLRWSNPDADFYVRLFDFLRFDLDAIHAFGLEWLRERLHAKAKHDRRLETALGMLERHGAIEGTLSPLRLTHVGELPAELQDAVALSAKYQRDQQKLWSLVQFIRTKQDPREFLAEYFD